MDIEDLGPAERIVAGNRTILVLDGSGLPVTGTSKVKV